MTDGQSYSREQTKNQALLLKNTPGVKVISIGIGNSVSKTELVNIASDRFHAFEVADFNSLNTINSEITYATCQSKLPFCRDRLPSIVL